MHVTLRIAIWLLWFQSVKHLSVHYFTGKFWAEQWDVSSWSACFMVSLSSSQPSACTLFLCAILSKFQFLHELSYITPTISFVCLLWCPTRFYYLSSKLILPMILKASLPALWHSMLSFHLQSQHPIWAPVQVSAIQFQSSSLLAQNISAKRL